MVDFPLFLGDFTRRIYGPNFLNKFKRAMTAVKAGLCNVAAWRAGTTLAR